MLFLRGERVLAKRICASLLLGRLTLFQKECRARRICFLMTLLVARCWWRILKAREGYNLNPDQFLVTLSYLMRIIGSIRKANRLFCKPWKSARLTLPWRLLMS